MKRCLISAAIKGMQTRTTRRRRCALTRAAILKSKKEEKRRMRVSEPGEKPGHAYLVGGAGSEGNRRAVPPKFTRRIIIGHSNPVHRYISQRSENIREGLLLLLFIMRNSKKVETTHMSISGCTEEGRGVSIRRTSLRP